MAERWTKDEVPRLAANGVNKVDLLGERGITTVTSEEIAAMAAVIALSGALPPLPDRLGGQPLPNHHITRKEQS